MKRALTTVTTLLCLIVTLNVSAQEGTIMNADGSADTYRLMKSFGYGEEVPDCGHKVKHIEQMYDSILGKQVFVFTLHEALDDDRCGSKDRQRAEIKTFAPSPETMKGHRGKTHIYRWKFLLDKGFQPTARFCHIHQVKADSGPNAGAPIITITPRVRNGEELLCWDVVPADNNAKSYAQVDLNLFKGVWVEATETITHENNSTVKIEIRRVDNGQVLLKGKAQGVDLWREGAHFNRPKYGIYRSLLSRNEMRDESVRFADIELIEITKK